MLLILYPFFFLLLNLGKVLGLTPTQAILKGKLSLLYFPKYKPQRKRLMQNAYSEKK